MTEVIFHWVSEWPPGLAAFLLAMLPIIEIRGALPYAVHVMHLPFWQAFLLGVAGNMVPSLIILSVFEYFLRLSEKVPWFKKHVLDRYISRTRRLMERSYERYGAIALIAFTAIPFPLTGAWTASVGAVVFGIRKRVAIPSILIGVMISGLFVATAAGLVGTITWLTG